MKNLIKKPLVAGLFYPANARTLQKEVEQYLQNSELEKEFDNVFGIICPHAGYRFSGPTAAFGFNCIKNKEYDTVIVIAPSHSYISHQIGVYDYDFYRTPLGDIPIEKEFVSKLMKNEIIGNIQAEVRPENSLEVQLPFLQYVLEDFNLVPILIRDQSLQTLRS